MSAEIDDLKQRARAGDAQALQQLRDMGFFGERAATAPPAHHQVGGTILVSLISAPRREVFRRATFSLCQRNTFERGPV
jgi:hypothetical protein